MSIKNSASSRTRARAATGGFSSLSLNTYNIPKISTGMNQVPITAVTMNRSLLTPVRVDIDPAIQTVRTQEKEQIKTLNNRFAAYIDKVKFLEQQNKMLETKWKLLQGKTTASSNAEPMLKNYIVSLQRQLESLNNDKHRLDVENNAMHRNVDDFRTKYEDEFNKRHDAENQFVLLKKDVDSGYLSKVDLDDKLVSLTDEFNFYKALYDVELRELQENLKDTSVVVQMDNSRGLNMDQIVSEVKAQYEDIAAHNREDAEAWYRRKFDEKSAEADIYGSELRSTKGEIAELTRMINRLRNEIEAVKALRASLDKQMAEAEEQGDAAVRDANARIKDLESALQRAKQDMARQVREYQELMNIKLALDIEISTYRKLLEGEEERLGQQSVLSIQTVPSKLNQRERQRSGPLYIKTETTNVTIKEQR